MGKIMFKKNKLATLRNSRKCWGRGGEGWPEPLYPNFRFNSWSSQLFVITIGGIDYCANTVPFVLPLRSFQSDPVPFAFSRKGAEVLERTSTHSVFDQKNPFLYCSYHSCTVPLWKDWCKNRGGLWRNGNVPVDGTVFWYRSSTVPYRSNTVPLLRYLNGTFEDTSVPFHYRSFTVPARSDTGPLYRQQKTADGYFVTILKLSFLDILIDRPKISEPCMTMCKRSTGSSSESAVVGRSWSEWKPSGWKREVHRTNYSRAEAKNDLANTK